MFDDDDGFFVCVLSTEDSLMMNKMFSLLSTEDSLVKVKLLCYLQKMA